MLSAKFKPKTTAAASRGSLATAPLSCFIFPRFRDIAGFLLGRAIPPYSTRIFGVFPLD